MSGSGPGGRRIAVAAGLGLLYLAVRLPLLPVPLERDEGLFGVMGQAILRGDVPYRDVFDHKPPGVFYLYALALLAVPATAAGVHAFLAVWNAATTVCVAALAGALAGPAAAAWASLAFIVASAAPSVQGFSATTEMLLLLPLTGSVLAATRASAAAGRRRTALAVASGALAAATFWTKQPALLAAGAGPVALAAAGGRALRRDLLPWAGGAVAVTLVVTVPFAVLRAWREFWYWSFTHSWLYGAVPVSHWPLRLAASVTNVGRDLGPALAVGVAGIAVGLARGCRGAGLLAAFLALSVASAFHSRFFYTHYFAVAVPAIAVAAGVGLVWNRTALRAPAAAFAAVVTVVLVGVPFAVRPWYWLGPDPVAVTLRTLGPQGFDAAPLVAAYLRERTRPDERIFVYGSEPEIAFLAGRRDLNPFGAVYPLTWTWPRHREFQERVWARLEAAPPRFLVLARNPTSLVRSPAADPFFEERLTALGARAYRLDAVVLEEPGGGFRFAPSPPAADGGERVVFELWRRDGDGPGAG